MAVVSYKCPNCGGPLTFDADKQKFDCDYCYSEFTEQELIEKYKDMDEALGDNENDRAEKAQQENTGTKNQEQKEETKQDDSFEKEAVYYTCPSCGAEIVTTDTTAATECFYCHNPVVLAGRLSGDFKPDCVIPFEISKEKAIGFSSPSCLSIFEKSIDFLLILAGVPVLNLLISMPRSISDFVSRVLGS